jgi:hypothetical protein
MVKIALRFLVFAARQHRLQIRVIRFWFGAAGEADFFWFAGRGHADALNALGRFLFSVIDVGDLIFETVDCETDFGDIKLLAKVMRVLKLRLRPASILWEFEFNLAGQTKSILQVPAIAG